MKEKATKLNKGIRGTNSVPKTMNKGKRTAKQGRADKKVGRKRETISKKEERNCLNTSNATEDTLQCREEEVCGGGGRLWSNDTSSSLGLWDKQMMAGPQRQVHPVRVGAPVLDQWGSQPRDAGSQRQLDILGPNQPHPHHLPPLQAWPRHLRPHHQGPQYTSSPHPSLPYTRSYLPSPQHSWPHHLRPHHPLPASRSRPHQRPHQSQAISLSRRARIYAQPRRPGILNYCCSVL